MEQLIITGTVASGLIGAISGLGTEIKSLKIDVPLNDGGSTDPTVTISGVLSGAYAFHRDATLDLRFGTENVYITTANFSGNYSAIVRYVRYGDQTCMLNTRNMDAIPLPSRLTRRTPRSA